MNIAIIDRQAIRVACLRYTGPLGEPVGKFWRATAGPWLADHGLIDCPRYGVTVDDPMNTPAERCRYDACVELPTGLTLPDAETRNIAGGRYAVTRFKGTSGEIGPAWGAFLRECQAGRGLRIDESRQPFEHYPRGAVFDAKYGVFACELCLPVGS